VIETPETLFCNSFEIGHNKEAFCLIFKFQNPNGEIVKTVYITISPSGAKTLIEQLTAEMKDYEKEHGSVEPWGNPTVLKALVQNHNSEKYVA